MKVDEDFPWLAHAPCMTDAERAETLLVLDGMRGAEQSYVGFYRGLGPDYGLALERALAQDGAYDDARCREIEDRWEKKRSAVRNGHYLGAKTTRENSQTRRSKELSAHGDVLQRVLTGKWSVYAAACVLARRPGVTASVPTLRRWLTRYKTDASPPNLHSR